MAHGRLVRLGRHHVHVADGLEGLLEHEQSPGLDPVVVGDGDPGRVVHSRRGFGVLDGERGLGSCHARPPPAARPGRGRWRDARADRPRAGRRRPARSVRVRGPCCPLGWLACPFWGLSSLMGWVGPGRPPQERAGPRRRVCPGCRLATAADEDRWLGRAARHDDWRRRHAHRPAGPRLQAARSAARHVPWPTCGRSLAGRRRRTRR